MIIKIRILLYKSKINKEGKCPLRCRITLKKNRKEFSTGLFVNPKHWNSKKQKVLDDTEQSNYINTQLSLITTKINQAFLLLQIQQLNFDVIDVYNTYFRKAFTKGN